MRKRFPLRRGRALKCFVIAVFCYSTLSWFGQFESALGSQGGDGQAIKGRGRHMGNVQLWLHI
ncbi:hypothetical protein [Bradyrhizobium sp. Ash2021]|uniref:hypothetical protein n=1 Tax=Bradyrhizobium sp. Ash2021 TaxID=2954771 RepID=UPI00281544D1|nr:hypothetical protein [Bradyrhizobium sp. Ash2021]WMT75990.1 hypothetical protein NL528_06285 [Bradyrhizobium sp. Ash2021]